MHLPLTISLALVLLHSGHCDFQSQDACSNTSSPGEGVIVQLTNCTTSHIEVMYRGVEGLPDDSVISILYTCRYPNRTEVFESIQALIRAANAQSDTMSILEKSWTEHGIVCNFYACYSQGIFSSLNFKTSAVTCTVVDTDVCTEDCLNRGAVGCRTDTLMSIGPSHLGYECTCAEGYVWNATHCEDVDECNITSPDYQQQHNCSVEDGYHCVDVEGSYLCVHCIDRDEVWNGTSCISPTKGTHAMTRYYTTIGKPAYSTHGLDYLTSELGMSTEGAVIASVVTVSCFTLSLIGFLIGLSIVFCLCIKKRRDKSVHAEASYYPDYPSYPGYADKIDMNFEPPINGTDNLSFASPSLSVESRLNRLWEKDLDGYACQLGATTLHHLTTRTPQHHQSSERSSLTDLSSHIDQCGQNIDSCIGQYENDNEQHMDSIEPSLSTTVHEMLTDHPQQIYSEKVTLSPTETASPVRQLQHRYSCVTLESSVSAHSWQTNGRQFHVRQSSVSTPETDYAIGASLTDTSGYVVCVGTDHSEDERV